MLNKKRKLEVVDSCQEHWLDTKCIPVNWQLCVLCQRSSAEPLVQPKLEGYMSLVGNLQELGKLNKLPVTICLERFDEGSGILQTFCDNHARYHKLCRNKYDTQKINRLSGRQSAAGEETSPDSSINTRSTATLVDIKSTCLFCDGPSEFENQLLRASTFEIGMNIYTKAVEMQHTKLLNKIPSADFVALEIKYHHNCLTKFRNDYRSHQRSSLNTTINPNRLTYGTVLSELVQHMEEMFLYSTTAPVFRLADLTKMMAKRMSSLGLPTDDKSIHCTKLKNQLLQLIPGLREDKCGREILLSFEANMADAIREACEYNDMTDGMCLAKAARILRQDLFNDFPSFMGTFADDFISQKCVPTALVNFLTALLGGSNIDNGSPASDGEMTAAYTLAELIRFNSVKRQRTNQPGHKRHQVSHETPLPVYLGLMVHNSTRNKKIVEKLNGLGLSISYNRVQEIECSVTTAVCATYQSIGHVIPTCLRDNVFTTFAIDNIDHNMSSSTANDAFHGSSVTVIQHTEEGAVAVCRPTFDISWSRQMKTSLPSSFTDITPTGNVVSEIAISTVNRCETSCHSNSPQQLLPWLQVVEKALSDESCYDYVSFASHHSQSDVVLPKGICNNTLLPLLPDHIQLPATIRHLMNVIFTIIKNVNRDQAPVITADQPVYTVAKYIQWKFPSLYGEDKLIVMMGGLHIEMAVLNMIGKWLAGSGWTEMFLKAGVATSGRCESLLRSTHVKRARYAHEVSVASLYVVRNEAFKASLSSEEHSSLSLQEWISEKCRSSAQFLYWQTVIELECIMLNFVRSIRTSNYTLYVHTLKEICPWLFALDLTHYSRWLPVFVKTLEELPIRHPAVHDQFMRGHFTSRKTYKRSSDISDDQLHEQNNKVIKGDGGAVGLLGNESALLKWMVGGPEIARMITEFERANESTDKSINTDRNHHESTTAFQKRFIRHVSDVVKSLTEDGNPFLEDGLQTADSRKLIMSTTAETAVFNAKDIGNKKYEEFVKERLVVGSKSINDTIPRTNLELFAAENKPINASKEKIKDLRNDANNFCKLYVASQHRESDVDNFFSHENRRYPPSISEMGGLRKARNKSDILVCLEENTISDNETQVSEASGALSPVVVIDGAALIHMLRPGGSKTFHDYISGVIWPFVQSLLKYAKRVDIVFDRYLPNSLKHGTRLGRGSGQKVNVTSKTAIPSNFNKFLAVDENKKQLFSLCAKFLLAQAEEQIPDKIVVCTIEDIARSSSSAVDVSSLSPCSCEEADGRLLLHAANAVHSGMHSVTVRTVDSDVVVIAAYAFSKIPGLKQLWIDFGVGRCRKIIPVHVICKNLPPAVTNSLPFFHAFTGCDTVSTFCGIGKKVAWKTWMNFRDIDDTFQSLSQAENEEIVFSALAKLQRYVVLLYDRASPCTTVNECRRWLYTKKSRAIENIPPTAAALIEHCKRAVHQSRIWTACLSATHEVQDPCKWGWQLSENVYIPLWSRQPDIASTCSELVRCSCKKLCSGNCKCKKNKLSCTQLCGCDGLCTAANDDMEVEDVQSSDEEDVGGKDLWYHNDIEEDAYAENVLDLVFTF